MTISGATETHTLTDEYNSGITTGYDTGTSTGYDTSATYAPSSLNGTAGSLAQFSDVSMMVNTGASLGRSHSEGAGRPKPVRTGYHGFSSGYHSNSTSTPGPPYVSHDQVGHSVYFKGTVHGYAGRKVVGGDII